MNRIFKKSWVILVTSFICTCFACQQTPSTEAVVYKNREQMIEKASTTPKTEFQIPSVFSVKLTDSNGLLNVVGEAPITVLGDGTYDITEVSPTDFSQDVVDRFLKFFFENVTLYKVDDTETKNEVEAKIIKLQEQKSNYEKTEKLPRYEEKLRDLQKRYQDAPDTVAKQMSDGTLYLMHEQSTSEHYSYLGLSIGEENRSMGDSRYLLVENNTSQREMFVGNTKDGGTFYMPVTRGATLTYYDNRDGKISDRLQQSQKIVTGISQINTEAQSTLHISPVEAQKIAEKGLAALDVNASVSDVLLVENRLLDENVVITSDPVSYSYEIRCTSMVNQAPSVFFKMATQLSDDAYSNIWGQWGYEQISIWVDDTGIYRFDWVSPYKIGKTLVENAQLLSPDIIKDNFDKMIINNNAFIVDEMDLRSLTIEISQVFLGLQRIAEQDSVDSGLLVPIWSFFGTLRYELSDGTIETYDSLVQANPLLVINAIDGTMVDPIKGY